MLVLDRIYHGLEYDVDSLQLPDDSISMFISNIAKAFKFYDQGFNEFAQNVYNAKLAAQNEHYSILSLICDLFIGYSYQKLSLEKSMSWKKCETIYEDVYRIAQKSGYRTVMLITNWFKSVLLKDKGIYDEAYELVSSISNAIKRQRIKNRLLSIATYILTLNIVSKFEDKKEEIPILVYRITYEAERYGFEEYYKFIEDQRVLDPEYMASFKEAIKSEREAIEAEKVAEDKADAEEESIIQEGGVVEDEISENK